ncbi:MAG: DUF2764 family protein [Chlamydiae bacterium]|nr:DUF2764 family protein [Chlamydiota bacterium]
MRHYYLYTSLPPLEIQAKPETTFSNVLDSYLANLSKEDQKKLRVIQLFVDLTNIYAFITEGRWNAKGTLSRAELKEALEGGEYFPQYVYDFFDRYEDINDQKRFFSKILIEFFQYEKDKHEGFLKEFIQFERQLRLVLLAYRSKKIHVDLAKELQFEDLADPLVMDILARKDAAHVEFPYEFRDLKVVIEQAGLNPLRQHFAILKYRFAHYAHFVEQTPFSLDSLLAYFVQFTILDEYYGLSAEEGKQFLDSILERT